jgi:hypothetical protein
MLSGIDQELFYNRRTITRLAFLRKVYRMFMVIEAFLLIQPIS